MELLVAAMIAVSSQVTDVTVYNDRAQVVRTAEVELKQGINKLRFEDLPEAIDSRGIQVDGSGAATVLDVRFKIENLKEIPQEVWKELHAEQEELAQDEKAVLQRIEVLRQAKDFLRQIGSKVTHQAETEAEPELNPESWEKMLALYTGKNTEYDEGIRDAEVELKEIREALGKVRAEIAAQGANLRKQRRVVEVDLETAKAGKATLKLSYIVRGPKWIPTYDVRVDTETREMEVKYFALVRQSTGEDWKDVALKLSTANPGLGGQHPNIQPWRINVAKPASGIVAVVEVHRYPQDYSVETGQKTAPVVKSQDWEDFDRGDVLSAPRVGTRGATASAQGASVVFGVKGKSEIDSDNVEHRVAISTIKMPAHLRYSTVPKMDKHAYLKAKGTNPADYPFLKGNANIFMDGNYVATSQLKLVAPQEDFWIFLGVDESIKIEYKLVKQYESSEGFRGRTVRHSFEYLFRVKNTHSEPEELIIFDQLPISGNEEIKVKLVEPKYSENTDALEINNEKRIKWFLVLEAGEERDVPFSFQVEAPKDMKIGGLE